jgi:protein dithiol oxidoreductase (disulfide-forming)
MKRLLMIAGLSAALAACGQKAAAPVETPPAATAESTPAPAPAEASPAPAAPEAAPVASPAPAAAVDNAPAAPIPAQWVAGKNYHLINPAQATNVDAGQVEIIEFMWLGCPHCYEVNPYIEAWKKKLPANVKFKQEHVTWDAQRLPHARLFYTLQALGGDVDALVVKAFEEIHRRNNPLMANSEANTERLQEDFAVSNGVNAAAFRSAYKGFAVNTSIQRANQLIRSYRIDSVPVFIVNGKYRTDVGDAGGSAQLTQLLSDLAASERGR